MSMTFIGWRAARSIRRGLSPVASQRHRARYRLAAQALEQCEDRVLLATILGSAQNYAVLASSMVTNTGATAIVGNVGVSPGSAITGLSAGDVTGGTLHSNDAAASQAESDLATAYGVISGEASTHDLTGQDLGGLTLAPGVYHFDSSATLTGTLTLNAEGDPDARFDFQVGSTLITANNSAIQIINGGESDSVYFQVGGSATVGTNSALEGNILADQSITLDSGASMLEGRALSLDGAVSLDANQISAAEADVSVTTTSAVGPVFAGANVGYTITIANAGPDAAQSVALSDVVPANTTFVSDTQTGGPAFSLTGPAQGGTGTITGTIATLASGASATFSVVVLVSPSSPDGTTISNTADVTAATSDPDVANNSATVTNLTATQADLSATTTASAGVVFAGTTIAYTITLANAGPSDARDVGATNFPPANTIFVSEAQTSGPPFGPGLPGSTDVAYIATLPAGASASFTFVVQVLSSTPAGTTISDTTTITSDTTDPDLVNNSDTVTTLTATQADVSVTNTVAAGPGNAGDPVTYTITVANAGPSDAQTVTLSDIVPANTTFVSDAQTSGPRVQSHEPRDRRHRHDQRDDRHAGRRHSASFTVVVMVSAARAEGNDNHRHGECHRGNHRPQPANNSATVTTGSPVGTGADLSATTSSLTATAFAGSAVSYTVTFANAGPDDAEDVTASATCRPIPPSSPSRKPRDLHSLSTAPRRAAQADHRDDRNAGLGRFGDIHPGGSWYRRARRPERRSPIRPP